jgi:hypothetical protein
MQIPETNAINTSPQVIISPNPNQTTNNFSNRFKKLNPKQIGGILVVILLTTGVIITTLMSQNIQVFFSRAATEPGSYGNGNYGSDNYLGVSTIVSPSPLASPRKPGDVDYNSLVNIFDFNYLVGDFGQSGTNLRSDFNNNNKIDLFDFNILVSNFNR